MPAIDKEAAAKRAQKRQATLGLYTPKEVAEMFGFDERTMAIWRSKKEGPRYTKLGKSVYYRLDDISAWVEASVIETGNPPTTQEQYDMFPPCDCGVAKENLYERKQYEIGTTEQTTTAFATSESGVSNG